jgi:hypothetical protein
MLNTHHQSTSFIARPTFLCWCYCWCWCRYPLPKVNCKWWSGCFQYTGLPVYSLKYKLPKGRTCERCILHWHYLTGHKCVVPCLKSDKYYPNCKANPKYAGTYLTNTPYCGEPGASNPELFWNVSWGGCPMDADHLWLRAGC